MAQKHQAIIVGIGATGAAVADRFVSDYGDACGATRRARVPEHVAIVSHNEGDLAVAAVGCAADDDRWFATHDEPGLLGCVARAFERVLSERPDSDYSIAYQLDVFVVGAWADADFGHHLPLVLSFIEQLGHKHYGTMFTTRDDRQNARLLVHPLAISGNLPREAAREDIAELLARLSRWHQMIASEGRAFIPRFFIYDGFTNNLQMTREEMVGITANFLGLCIESGLRGSAELRRLLNFAVHGGDMFAVLNIGTIRFDRHRFREAAVDSVVGHVECMLLAKPDRSAELSVDRLKAYIDGDIVGAKHLVDDQPASEYRDLILEVAEKCGKRKAADLTTMDQSGIRTLIFEQKTFPRNPEASSPETLELFFDRNWLNHLLHSGQPVAAEGVAKGFAENTRNGRDRWYAELGRIRDRLDEGLKELLGPHRANYSLAAFCAALYRIRHETIAEGFRDLEARSRDLPGERWRFTHLQHLWARLRSQIWNTVPAHAMRYWMPVFAVLATVQAIALFRYAISRLDPNTDGAKMLTRFDGGVLELPVMILLAVLVTAVPLLVFYFFKRRHLQPFLRCDGLVDTKGAVQVDEVDMPESLDGDDDTGALPGATIIMARKMGVWWFRHGRLGSLGMAGALLKVAETRLEDVRERAQQVLARVEERHRTRSPQELAPKSTTYFDADILAPITPDAFADIVTGGHAAHAAAITVAQDLIEGKIDDFLATVVDEARLRAAIRGHMSFFSHGDVFALNECAADVARNLRRFVDVVDDRLSHGQIFHYLASEEEDKLIDDSQILLVAPDSAHNALEAAIQSVGVGYVRLYGSNDKDHIWGLRIIQDISTRSVARYMLADHDIQELDRKLCAWSTACEAGHDDAATNVEPWSELRSPA